jgi:hypothetical protein
VILCLDLYVHRGLNDLQRAGLPCGRVIRLLAHPFPRRLEVTSLSQSSCVSPVGLPDGRRGEGVGVGPNNTTEESLALYKSIKTL